MYEDGCYYTGDWMNDLRWGMGKYQCYLVEKEGLVNYEG